MSLSALVNELIHSFVCEGKGAVIVLKTLGANVYNNVYMICSPGRIGSRDLCTCANGHARSGSVRFGPVRSGSVWLGSACSVNASIS